MMETKCFETHEIHSGILAANEEFKRGTHTAASGRRRKPSSSPWSQRP